MDFGWIRGLVVLMVLVVPMRFMMVMVSLMVLLMVMFVMLVVLGLWLCSMCRVVYVGDRRRCIRNRRYEGRNVLFPSDVLRNSAHDRHSSSWLGMVMVRVLLFMPRGVVMSHMDRDGGRNLA